MFGEDDGEGRVEGGEGGDVRELREKGYGAKGTGGKGTEGGGYSLCVCVCVCVCCAARAYYIPRVHRSPHDFQ